MASAMKLWVVVYLSCLLSMQKSSFVLGKPQVPCFFIFGDSLADSGNNNVLNTTAKVNYEPYGIDFPYGPTGRFCNGRTTVDIITELLGFENYIIPFAYANGSTILRGVNYASGASGIRRETGMTAGTVLSMGLQLVNHKKTVSRITNILGKKSLAENYLNKCLYSVAMGSNDYINNYFLPLYYNTSQEYTLEEYAVVLIEEYSRQIMKLYEFGAKKVVLGGLGLIGCTPAAIANYGTNGSCSADLNYAAQLFNKELVSLVDQLNDNLTDAKFVYINNYEIGSVNTTALGFTVSNAGCCTINSGGLCEAGSTPCEDRSEYVFWDGYHPTDAFNQISANKSYSSYESADTYPMDISRLVELEFNPLVAEM
ncbi:GDSL esterase/lipase At4g18970-like [Argentina anserina]|uniref:GDSL esterase/lipase At4g18970-like n=1 Tax=Argentina anserina TaxID=57926 RepID=UPI0021768CD5|nr:GDSL esterase/lipase At4g18970-like [Potentilla anserina]